MTLVLYPRHGDEPVHTEQRQEGDAPYWVVWRGRLYGDRQVGRSRREAYAYYDVTHRVLSLDPMTPELRAHLSAVGARP